MGALHRRRQRGRPRGVLARPTAADRADERRGRVGLAPAAGRGRRRHRRHAAIFPGADGLDRFWANIVAGVNAITEVPAERWDVDTYYDPDAFTEGAGRRTPSKWGGFIPEVGFDALAYGIPPTSLASIEPVQLLSLEAAARALADAGYADREFDRELGLGHLRRRGRHRPGRRLRVPGAATRRPSGRCPPASTSTSRC